MNQIINLIWITLLPFLELRASIPYGILFTSLKWYWVFIICVITNILLAPILWLFLKYILFFVLKIRFIKRLYIKTITKVHRKVHHYIDRYGTLGLAIFIGIPLPGSGVYSGALAAYILGFKFKDYLIASIIGVLIAATIVTIVVVTGDQVFMHWFVKG